jgi:ribosomal-protein-serine acetyltransferase
MKPRLFPAKIETRRLIIKKHTVADADAMFKLLDLDRKRLGQFLHFVPLMLSVSDQRKFITRSRREWLSKESFSYGIFLREDGTFIGNIGVHTIHWAHDSFELGYWLGRDFEGHGYISEAVTALAAKGFAMGFHRVEIHCDPRNLKSRKVARRCGFMKEGILRGQRKVGGIYRDTVVFSLLANDARRRYAP